MRGRQGKVGISMCLLHTRTQAQREPRISRSVRWRPLPPTPSCGLLPAMWKGHTCRARTASAKPWQGSKQEGKGPELLQWRVRLKRLTGPEGFWEEESRSTSQISVQLLERFHSLDPEYGRRDKLGEITSLVWVEEN